MLSALQTDKISTRTTPISLFYDAARTHLSELAELGGLCSLMTGPHGRHDIEGQERIYETAADLLQLLQCALCPFFTATAGSGGATADFVCDWLAVVIFVS